jgi:hypothetical protein
MARIKLDLHDIYNNSAAIDRALQNAFEDAIEKRSVKWRSYRQRQRTTKKESRTFFATATYQATISPD